MAASWPDLEGSPSRDEVPAGRKLNLGCGAVILPREEGWVNADRNAAAGVDVRWDFWTLPWPLASGAFDFVLMSHLAEHIPHQVRVWGMNSPGPRGITAARPCREDGWFAVFRELHRILRPGGRVYIVGPYGLSEGAMQDPTHTRFIVPRTFTYLDSQTGPDYQLDYAFRTVTIDLLADPEAVDWIESIGTYEEQALLMARQWNIARTIRVILERA